MAADHLALVPPMSLPRRLCAFQRLFSPPAVSLLSSLQAKLSGKEHFSQYSSALCLSTLVFTACCLLLSSLQAKLSGKAPFSQYSSLPGLNVVWGNPADPAAIPSGWFDVVYDNNGKDMAACQPLIDHFKVAGAEFLVLGCSGCSPCVVSGLENGLDLTA